jgi:hypothetical protein
MKRAKHAKTNCNRYNWRTGKWRRPHRKLRDMIDDDKAGMQWSETIRNGGRLYWKPRSTMDCSIGGGVEMKNKHQNTGTLWPSYKVLARTHARARTHTHTENLKAPK